jgi:hypothetical protein
MPHASPASRSMPQDPFGDDDHGSLPVFALHRGGKLEVRPTVPLRDPTGAPSSASATSVRWPPSR